MSRYRRLHVEGGTFFFTVTLADRSSDLLVRHIDLLRNAYKAVQSRLPFETIAIVIPPDHLHAMWTLPENDAAYPQRWSLIKSGFSRSLRAADTRSPSKVARREKGIWQRRYWEHTIHNDEDFGRHFDYIHFNPVHHGLVTRVRDWPPSSFHRYVRDGWLQEDWGGDMREIQARFGEP